MSTPRKIGVFYSHGPHFVRILKLLRKEDPQAVIVAFIPPAFPEIHIAPYVTRHQFIPSGANATVHPMRLLKTLQTIRGERLDVLIIMFDSPKLRLLAALSGAASCQCQLVDGRTDAVRFQVLRPLLNWAYRRLHGQITYWRIRRIVHGQRVE